MTKEDLQKFLTPSIVSVITQVLLGIVFIMISFFSVLGKMWIVAIFTFPLGYLALSSCNSGEKYAKQLIQKYEDAGLLDVILSDFENGTRLDNGDICLGEQVIITEHPKAIFAFDEIIKLYKKEHYHAGTDDDPGFYTYTLRARLKTGEERDLISIPDSYEEQEEPRRVCEMIQMKNPSIVCDVEFKEKKKGLWTR